MTTSSLIWRSSINNRELLPTTLCSSLVGKYGDLYTVWVDLNRRPQITRISQLDSTDTETVPLAPPEYQITENGHCRFSMGIDRQGYLHIMGGMQNYNEQTILPYAPYSKQSVLYWRSNEPNSITKGFTFHGQPDNPSRPNLNTTTYPFFFNDHDDDLFLLARVRAISDTHDSGETGLGFYLYDPNKKTWTARGNTVDRIRDGTYFPVLAWANSGMAPLGWYNSCMGSAFVDSQNHIHLALSMNSNSKFEGNDTVIYAKSPDKGETWYRTDGSKIPSLPIRGEASHPSHGDLVVSTTTAPWINSEVRVAVDHSRRPLVSLVQDRPYLFDGNSWTTLHPHNLGYYAHNQSQLGLDFTFSLTPYADILLFKSFTEPPVSYSPSLGLTQFTSLYACENEVFLLGRFPDDSLGLVQVNCDLSGYLPEGWKTRDIGSYPAARGTSDYRDGTFRLTTNGSLLDEVFDSCYYIHRDTPLNYCSICPDIHYSFTLSAQMEMRVRDDTSVLARAGLMIRARRDREAEISPSDARVSFSLAPKRKQLVLAVRDEPGSATVQTWIDLPPGTTTTDGGKISLTLEDGKISFSFNDSKIVEVKTLDSFYLTAGLVGASYALHETLEANFSEVVSTV